MTKSLYSIITNCRLCESSELEPILDLGNQPPANSLRKDLSESLPSIPLAIVRCGSCGVIQLTASVDPSYLFKHYVWVTGTSQTARDYSKKFCDELCTRSGKKNCFVVEVASNDGTFLQRFIESGHRVRGVDPAENIAVIANKNGIPTTADFFGLKSAQKVVQAEGLADIVFARNVLPHVEVVNDVVAGMAHCLSPDGIGAAEFHYAPVILDELHYDSIYHEHLFYYSLKAMQNLLVRHGLHPFDIMWSPISGGSAVLYFSKAKRTVSPALKKAVDAEEENGVGTFKRWHAFADQCRAHRGMLNELISKECAAGKKAIGYGASARSSTLLNFCGISNRHLECVADKNPIKHNRLTPGSNIPIIAPEEAFAKGLDVVVLLAWNFKDEIIAALKEEYQFTGTVIVPLPGNPQVITL